ncbi:MAG TPA: hypothetical protein PKN99_09545 [Cyclobacteriaceae bacterium]|nr:hypothetical protein [Cyclobacteriaceae bacterium]
MRLSLIIILCSTSAMAQSPWVAEKGNGFAQLGYTTIGPYKDLFLSDGNAYPLSNEITDRTLQVYGEYGIGSGTSIITTIPVKILTSGGSLIPSLPIRTRSGDFTTLGNIQLAARHNFVNKKVVFSGQLLAELPTSGYDEATGLRGGLNALSIIPTLSAGFSNEKLYEFVSVGAAIRSNDYSSEWRLGIELGYQLIKRIFIIGVIDIVQNFENGNAIESANQLGTGLYLNNQSYFAYGIKGIVGFTDSIGISGAFYGAGSGNLVAKSPSINFGLYYKW